MKNVKIVDKGVGIWYQDSDVYEKSSEVSVYNLFEQSWTDLQAERLAHLFNNDQAKFEHRRKLWQDGRKGADLTDVS